MEWKIFHVSSSLLGRQTTKNKSRAILTDWIAGSPRNPATLYIDIKCQQSVVYIYIWWVASPLFRLVIDFTINWRPNHHSYCIHISFSPLLTEKNSLLFFLSLLSFLLLLFQRLVVVSFLSRTIYTIDFVLFFFLEPHLLLRALDRDVTL